MVLTDKVEDMTLDTYVPSDSTSKRNFEMLLHVLEHEDAWRLVLLNFPAADGFYIFNSLRHYWRNRDDVLAVHTNEFVDDLIQAIRSGESLNRERFVIPQVLLLDDIHWLMTRESTQYELYLLLKKRLEQEKITLLFSVYNLAELRTAFRDDLIQLLALGIKE